MLIEKKKKGQKGKQNFPYLRRRKRCNFLSILFSMLFIYKEIIFFSLNHNKKLGFSGFYENLLIISFIMTDLFKKKKEKKISMISNKWVARKPIYQFHANTIGI